MWRADESVQVTEFIIHIKTFKWFGLPLCPLEVLYHLTLFADVSLELWFSRIPSGFRVDWLTKKKTQKAPTLI